MLDRKDLLTFGEHLEIMRKMLIRIIAVVVAITIAMFCFKDIVFDILLAPSSPTFCTYKWIEQIAAVCGFSFTFEEFHTKLIATELTMQFMTHLRSAFYFGILGASPYILYELFRFISPALYDKEKKYSLLTVSIVYTLFVLGVLMAYFILFPISFRFLSTYSVSEVVDSMVSIDSYITTFIELTLTMGLVFQLPVISFILAKLGIINHAMLAQYRKHAFVLIMIVAAIITPPDVMTLLIVTLPLYLLFEASIWVVKCSNSSAATAR